MKKARSQSIPIIKIITAALLLPVLALGPAAPAVSAAGKVHGYTSAAAENTGGGVASFLACGTDGRLDRISVNNKVDNIPLNVNGSDLTQVLVTPDVTLVGGYSGALLYSRDGNLFTSCTGVGGADILGLAAFKGKYYACARNGSLLESKDAVSWHLIARLSHDPVISIAASDRYIMAITAGSDIFVSKDGNTWSGQNFNTYYNGYYEKYVFTKLAGIGPSIYIIGYPRADRGRPLIMWSDSGGEVWMFKTLGEINKEMPEKYYPLTVNSIVPFTDELLAAANNGRILTLTSCSECNTITGMSDMNSAAMAISGDNLLVVGGGYSYALLNALSLRQNNIAAPQALADFRSGAKIIDVRTDAEYNQSHVKGCIHIPVGQIQAMLPQLVPDTGTELIFYCAAGARAQQALETAKLLGYQNVFNLGGLSNWPYETESS